MVPHHVWLFVTNPSSRKPSLNNENFTRFESNRADFIYLCRCLVECICLAARWHVDLHLDGKDEYFGIERTRSPDKR